MRGPCYRGFARLVGADLSEARPPIEAYPSFGAFFARRLREGLRPFPADEGLLPSPVDGAVQAIDPIEQGTLLQAKGRPYPVAELLGLAEASSLEGGTAWTLYLSPRDYHRIHAPVTSRLLEASWIPGSLYPVHGRSLEGRARVLSVNERVVLRLDSERGPYYLVLVGALNVGRIRVVGVAPGHRGPVRGEPTFERGAELGRFEMGSTVVLIWPPEGPRPREDLQPGSPLRMGEAIGSFAPTVQAAAARS